MRVFLRHVYTNEMGHKDVTEDYLANQCEFTLVRVSVNRNLHQRYSSLQLLTITDLFLAQVLQVRLIVKTDNI